MCGLLLYCMYTLPFSFPFCWTLYCTFILRYAFPVSPRLAQRISMNLSFRMMVTTAHFQLLQISCLQQKNLLKVVRSKKCKEKLGKKRVYSAKTGSMAVCSFLVFWCFSAFHCCSYGEELPFRLKMKACQKNTTTATTTTSQDLRISQIKKPIDCLQYFCYERREDNMLNQELESNCAFFRLMSCLATSSNHYCIIISI